MIYHVIGKKQGSFLNEKTGEVIDYSRIYATAPFEVSTYEDGPKTEGFQALEIKAPPAMVKDLKVDADYRLIFNMKGRLEEIVPVGKG